MAVSVAELEKIGVISHHFSSVDDVNSLALERGYKNRDEITVSPAALGDVYETKVKGFFNEHIHEDEEIRYILDGEGFFDVRSNDDRWLRIRLVKGDLIVLPAGIYHRFTTDNKNVRSESICGFGGEGADFWRSTLRQCVCSRKKYVSLSHMVHVVAWD